MSNVRPIANLDDLLRRYYAGEALPGLLQEWDLPERTFRNRLRLMGLQARGFRVSPKTVEKARRQFDVAEMVRLYTSGESELSLAKRYGVDRGAIHRRLEERSIPRRGRSEAEIIKWEKMTPQQREAQVTSAHQASKGRVHSPEEKEKRALTNERTMGKASASELMLAGMLTERSIAVALQKAIGPYNVDIAINEPAIAVEVFGGGWHDSLTHSSRYRQRIPYLLDRGWSVLIVWLDSRRYPLGAEAANYVVTFMEELRREEAPRGQYRVIRGNGECMPGLSAEF